MSERLISRVESSIKLDKLELLSPESKAKNESQDIKTEVLDSHETNDLQAKIEASRAEVLSILSANDPSSEKTKLSTEDAAHEYLSILAELSSNFTNPRSVTNALPNGDTRKIGTNINNFINAYDKQGDFSKINFRLDQANSIIDAEIAWKESGERYALAKTKLEDLENARSKQGLFKKIFSYGKYKRNRQDITKEIGREEIITYKSNILIQSFLGRNYSETNQNSYYPSDLKTSPEKNTDQNSKFFDVDDRSKKIQRAIELKQKYLTDVMPEYNFMADKYFPSKKYPGTLH